MIRIGLIGVNTSHADAFSRIFNGDGDAPAAIWGQDADRVAELADRHRIERVVAEPVDLLGEVDGVLLVDDTDGGALHALRAPVLSKPGCRSSSPSR